MFSMIKLNPGENIRGVWPKTECAPFWDQYLAGIFNKMKL